MSDLSGARSATLEVREREPTMEQHAREMCGLPDEWRVYSWDARKPGFVIIHGAVTRERYVKGARKGAINWDKRDRLTDIPVTISNEAHQAWLADWERETGRCATCKGSRQELAGWNRETGEHYRPCRRCKATGLATPSPREEA